MSAKICRVVVNDSEKPGYRPEMPFFYTQALSFDDGKRIEWSDGWETYVEYPSHAIAEERAAEIVRRFGMRCHAHAIARPENELPAVETLPAPAQMLPIEERKTTPAPAKPERKLRRKIDRVETLRRLAGKAAKHEGEPRDQSTKRLWWKENESYA